MNKGRWLFAALVTILFIATPLIIKRSGQMSSLNVHKVKSSSEDLQPIPQQVNSSKGPSVEKPSGRAFILLQGEPRGGEVSVWVKGKELTVKSVAKESTQELAGRIAEAINKDSELQTYGISAQAKENEVAVALSKYWLFLCTTDSGLNVPPAPRKLRAKMHDDNLVDLTWQVPKEGYDSVHVLRGTLPIGDDMSGSATNFSDYLTSQETQTYYVFGVRGRTPSCAASVVVSTK